MALEQRKVYEIVDQAVSKSWDIPEFQREFIWDPEQVKLLAESLHRRYPIGSFLLWDSSKYQEAKTAQGAQASLWIVDGQQRITALCLLLGCKPYWWDDAEEWDKALKRYDVMVNLLPEQSEDRLGFALPNPIRRNDPRWISLRRILAEKQVGNLTQLSRQIADSISSGGYGRKEKIFEKVHSRIHSLWQIREQDIPIVKINHEVEDVAEIFARLNQEGTRVKEADVVLALAAVQNPGWIREEYLPFRNKLEDNGWDLDAGIFIRTMSSIGYKRARLIEVPRDFWSPDKLVDVWKDTKQVISEVLKQLAEFGIINANLLPSTNSLIPLFVLHHRWNNSSGYRFGQALRWFLLANRDGRYSGSAITSLNEDVRAITEAQDFDQAIGNIQRRLRVSSKIEDEEFLDRYDRAGQRFLRLMLYLVLFKVGARDWLDGTGIGYDKTGPAMIAGFEPQWHHIYPRSVLKAKGFKDDDIDALANITVLNERTHVNKFAGKQPWHYLQKYDISEQQMRGHFIPESFATNRSADQWRVERYMDFIVERAQLLARGANEFLQSLK